MSVPSSSELAMSLDILLVENHPDTAKFLRMYLEQLGHVVRVAGSVQEALAKLSQANAEVLISDIGLPDGDGWEIMERAGLPPTVYAIAMSGFGAFSDRTRSESAGFRHHLTKPFSPDELDGYLEEALREKNAR
jgi:CheY-like chemotaxis protein